MTRVMSLTVHSPSEHRQSTAEMAGAPSGAVVHSGVSSPLLLSAMWCSIVDESVDFSWVTGAIEEAMRGGRAFGRLHGKSNGVFRGS
jgi:hypothetical protein